MKRCDPNVSDRSYKGMEMLPKISHRYSFGAQLVHQIHRHVLFPILPERHVRFFVNTQP